MKVLPLALAAVISATAAPLGVKAESGALWHGYANLEFVCAGNKMEGCPSHPANSYNPYGTHRPTFLPDVSNEEKGLYTYTKVLNPGKEVCGRVGWQTNHIGWVPQGNGQVLTKWKEDHSGISCKTVGKVTQATKKPVWMLVYSRDGKFVADGLYADGEGRPMAQTGHPQFTNTNSAPWMGHAVCENAREFYGETSIGPAGRMVNGHGYATLVTGERVPATSFMVNYVKRDTRTGVSSWRSPVCEVVRLDLREAPKFQKQFASVTTDEHRPSGSTLVKQDY